VSNNASETVTVRGQSLTTTDADGTDTATAHHRQRRREANVRIAALPRLRRASCNYLDYLPIMPVANEYNLRSHLNMHSTKHLIRCKMRQYSTGDSNSERRQQHKYRLFIFNVVLIVILRHFNKYIPTLDFKIANIYNVYSLGNSCNVESEMAPPQSGRAASSSRSPSFPFPPIPPPLRIIGH